MFGRTPIYPGNTKENVITDNSIESSEAVKRHFHNMEKARTFHRQAYCSRILKEALKARLAGYHDRDYQIGEEIVFLVKNGQLTGPEQ